MKRILKKKTFWLMLFIISLGTWLRLIFINKPDGLWNDEYVSWMIASIPLGKNFVHEIFAQCHMPFYYLYLKFFIHFFGNSDLMLRLTSVLPGVLSIPVMYFVGKEFKEESGEQLGILCASVTALSSFLIYFSQEVRFYALLFLFSGLTLLFTLKLLKKQNWFNVLFFIIFNFLIIFTHTIGFIFVFFNLILVSLLLKEKYKKLILGVWIVLSALTLMNLPLLSKIFVSHPLSQWWSHFTVSKIGFLITDYFSPILTNIVSAPDNFFYRFDLIFILFAIVPSTIALAGIIKGTLKKKEKTDYSTVQPFNLSTKLFYVALSFLLVLVIMAISGKLLFVTKYSLEVYPTLILLMCFGILEFKRELRYFLIFSFCFLNLFYILINTNSAPKMHRSEGHKIVANLIKNAKLNKGDFIILNYYPQNRFEKYFNFDKYRVISVNKGNFTEYSPEKFNKRFNEEIMSKIKPGQKVALVILNDVAVYSPMQLSVLKENPDEYKNAPIVFMAFSQIRNSFFEAGLKKLQISRIEEKGSWTVVTFVKK